MAERRNLNALLNWNYAEFFQSIAREVLLYGGAGAGKTYAIADKLLIQQIAQPQGKIKVVVCRRTLPSLRRSVLDILETRAAVLGMPFDLNKGDWVARSRNVEFWFLSLNNVEDYAKLKSITDVDFIWANELPEIREEDYEELIRRLRGGGSAYEQVIADFNPIGRTSWVYKRFFERNIGNVEKYRFTVYQNHPDFLKTEKAKRYIESLERWKEYDPNAYKIYFLGEWGELEGVIFDWDVIPLPADLRFDEFFYGGDFGYSVNPAVIVKIYRKADHYWVLEIVYRDGLTNQDLAKKFREIEGAAVVKSTPSYWDSSEPKSIEELYREGINAKPSIKGPDSVRMGLDFLKGSCKIHIVDGSENISREVRSYMRRKDKNGNILNEPVKINNHAIDAIRYAITTHCSNLGKKGAAAFFSEESFY